MRSEHPVRIAVVGAGMMGRNHLRVYGETKGVEIVAVVDSDAERAARAAARFGGRASTDLGDVLGAVDAVSLCTPSSSHAPLGLRLLEAGVHCLIEKPLATCEADVLALMEAAEANGAVLLVGHIERFNPAVTQLARILETGHRVMAIDVQRLSAVRDRAADVDVVGDLMVHDLDVVLSLIGEAADSLVARSVRANSGRSADYVSALLSFPGGALANLTASRISQNRVRELRVTTDLGLVTLNYSTQEIAIYRQEGQPVWTSPEGDDPTYQLDYSIERVLIQNAEPLVLELRHFVDSVRGAAKPRVDAAQALEVMRLVWRIQAAVAEGARHG